MPSYDIIPLASDLLDYTIQRVKQKEAEYKPVKAYIMVGDQLVEKLLYDKVKDDGKPHFPKSQTFHLCAELQDCAVRILKGCEAANGRYFETEYEERLKDLDGVLIECQTIKAGRPGTPTPLTATPGPCASRCGTVCKTF